MNSYAPVSALKQRLGITDTTDDTTLRLILEAASRMIDKYCGRHFYVYEGTKYYDAYGSPSLVIDDLLAASEINLDYDCTGNEYNTTLNPTDYLLYPLNEYPKWKIRLHLIAGDYAAFPNYLKTVEISGEWGYGDGESATPYEDSGATCTVADATSTSVTASNGAKFEAGQTILVEGEQMYITAISASTLTVKRAVNGTTGAAHSAKSAYIYRYPEAVREAAIITASRLWKRRESGYATVIGTPELGQIEVVRGLDPDVRMLVEPYRKLSIGAV